MKKCLYCKCELDENSVIDFCESCGKNAFSDKMLKAIIENMERAREIGDLNQGSISQDLDKKPGNEFSKNLSENC